MRDDDSASVDQAPSVVGTELPNGTGSQSSVAPTTITSRAASANGPSRAGLPDEVRMDSLATPRTDHGAPTEDRAGLPMQSLAVTGTRPLSGSNRAASAGQVGDAAPDGTGSEQSFEMHVSAVGADGHARAMRMLSKVLVAVHSGLSEPVQTELSELLITLQNIREEQTYQLLDSLDIALSLLLVSENNVGIARRIRENINARMERRSFTRLIRRNPAPANVAIGMFAFLFLISPVLILMWMHIFSDRAAGTVYSDPDVMVFLVITAGILGSATSTMTRVSKFQASYSAGPFLIFLNGFFRPFIGASFAIFLYAALNSGVVSVNLPAVGYYPFFYTALCFIAGFSEQLVPDLIQKVERNLTAQQIDVSERRSG